MNEPMSLLPDSLPTLGFGGIAGFIVGYRAKKITKLTAILLGVLFIAVQLLAYFGFVTVNWCLRPRDGRDSMAHARWSNPRGACVDSHDSKPGVCRRVRGWLRARFQAGVI